MSQDTLATAIHEAGHGVMAYLLHRPFKEISLIEDDDSLGRVRLHAPGDWFQPDLEVDGRGRSLIEDHVMITLAGAETEAAWYARQSDAPDGWRDAVDKGAAQDMYAGAWLWADHVVGGGGPELEAYLEWLRQRVLGFTGRGADFDPGRYFSPVDDFLADRMRFGDKRFWALVAALADAVQAAGSLTWRRARTVLREADPWLTARGPVR